MKTIFNKEGSIMNKKILFSLFISIFLVSCSPTPSQAVDSGKLNVIATTSIVADVVSQVGGDLVAVQILLPEGTDPHSFDPTPQDIAKIADAYIVFANGAGLEAFIENLLESAGAEEKIIEVSTGIELLVHPSADEDHGTPDASYRVQAGDPHTWTDPNNVIIWVENIKSALIAADPENAKTYAANASTYTAELKEIDSWIHEEIAQIPEENRKIVTDHRLMGYYVEEYGLEMAGTIIPGYSSLSEPSAQDLAQIEDAIRELGVKAIFVGNTVNPNLGQRIAEDTGVKLVFFYTGSLSPIDGEAGTYLDYLRYNTNAFVNALK